MPEEDPLPPMNDDPADSPLANLSSLPDASFHMVLAHLYRAEMNRMTAWRVRLDTTSNWAILLTTGVTTVTLGSERAPHYVLLLGLALIGFCLFIEARRYQHLHHSKWRLQLMERYYFGEVLQPGGECPPLDWRKLLATDLCQPHYTIHWLLAMRLRLRRNYLMLLYFATGIWVTKVFIHPESVSSPAAYYERLAVGSLIPSWLVIVTAVIFVGGATLLAFVTPSEEALEEWTHQKHSTRI